MNKTKTRSDYDSAWKETIRQFFPECLAFFYPALYDAIAWSQGYTFLEKELHKITRDSKTGKRYADMLIQVYLLTGEEMWVLIHIEVQSQVEAGFEERMFIYHYRIYDHYHRPVISLAILIDNQANWRPHQFSYQFFGCRLQLDFPVIKLLDYNNRSEELANDPSPFAVITLAQLHALSAKESESNRYQTKFSLIKMLYQRGYSKEQILGLFRFIDWVISLPEALELQLWTDVEQFEKETAMTYIASFERFAQEKGKFEGKLEGKLEQAQKSVTDALNFRFDSVPERISYVLENLNDLASLRELLRLAVTTDSLTTFEQQLVTLTHVQPA